MRKSIERHKGLVQIHLTRLRRKVGGKNAAEKCAASTDDEVIYNEEKRGEREEEDDELMKPPCRSGRNGEPAAGLSERKQERTYGGNPQLAEH